MTTTLVPAFFQISLDLSERIRNNIGNKTPDIIIRLTKDQFPIGLGWGCQTWRGFWGWDGKVARRVTTDLTDGGIAVYVVHVWTLEKAATSVGELYLNLHSAVNKTDAGKRAQAKSEPRDTTESVEDLDRALCEASDTSLETTIRTMKAWILKKESEFVIVPGVMTAPSIRTTEVPDVRSDHFCVSELPVLPAPVSAYKINPDPSIRNESEFKTSLNSILEEDVKEGDGSFSAQVRGVLGEINGENELAAVMVGSTIEALNHVIRESDVKEARRVSSRRAKRERNRARKLRARLGQSFTYSPPAYSYAGCAFMDGMVNGLIADNTEYLAAEAKEDKAPDDVSIPHSAILTDHEMGETRQFRTYTVYPFTAWDSLKGLIPIFQSVEKPRTVANMSVVYIQAKSEDEDLPELV